MLTRTPENISQDLESFASHGGRSTITTKDVMLLTRRNDGLKEILEEFVKRKVEKEEEGGGGAKGKGKRKR